MTRTYRNQFVIVALLLLSAADLIAAQQRKLSEPFSRASVSALRAINATGWALPSSVRELEGRQAEAQAKMEEAKDAAQSEDDTDAFIYLQRYQLQHSQNFADYSNAISRTARTLKGKNTLQRASTIVDKNPTFVARKRKELACAAALEKSLQSRLFSPPRVCALY